MARRRLGQETTTNGPQFLNFMAAFNGTAQSTRGFHNDVPQMGHFLTTQCTLDSEKQD